MKKQIAGSRSVAAALSIAAGSVIALLLGAFAFGVAQLNHDLAEKKAIAQLQEQTRLVKAMLRSFDAERREQSSQLLDDLMSTIQPHQSPASIDMERTQRALEHFSASRHAAVTLFRRDGNDLIAVLTTLKTANGTTAIAADLPKNDRAAEALLAGGDYSTLAVLFGRHLITAYRPLFGADKTVNGAVSVALDITAGIKRLKTEISALKVGETGYFYALNARPGPSLGTLVIHPTQEGKNILDATDADGHTFIREMLRTKHGVIHYPWINQSAGETKPRMKVVVYDEFPAWGWLIAGGAYDDDLSRDSDLQRNVTLATAFGVLLVLTLLIFLMTRRIVGRPLGEAMRVFDRIGSGQYDNPLVLDRADEIGALFRSLETMQKNLDRRTREDARIANEALRIKRALDKASTNMMVADRKGTLIYLNEALAQLMHSAEDDLRKDLPNFRADHLLGSRLDALSQDPAHQSLALAGLQDTHSTQIQVGGRIFRLVTNPVIDDQGERLGSVIEWTDRTHEVASEQELASLLAAAVKGDFTKRLSLEGKSGFFHELADGMNRLLQIVSSGLADIARVLEAIAQGDLTQGIATDYQGTFGQLKAHANQTVARLQEIVIGIKESTMTINTAAQEIAAGSADLSRRTEMQASSLEETASAMEELSSTVRQNEQNALQANGLTQSTNEMAVRGGEVVQNAVDTMMSIQESSRRIADIIGVIDAIAFQTNLLALNAAVEAARAGEHGRGFSVVASEVRSLAQRSAQAAKEIKALILDSTQRVDSGAALVQATGHTMSEIMEAFKQVATLVNEITDASREQSSGIEQVSQAVIQMDDVTQQNAALVEEAAAAAESLVAQAAALAKGVSIFKLDADSARAEAEHVVDATPLERPSVRAWSAPSQAHDEIDAAIAGNR